MRRARWAWAVVVCAAAAAGCLSRSGGSTRARSLGPTPPAEGLFVQSLLIEQPVGDPFLNRELWAAGLPATLSESDALLAENGLRAAVLRGNLPPRFQTLLDSKTDTVNPHGLTFGTRKDAVIPTAGPVDPCDYDVLTGLSGKRLAVHLSVRPEATPDGRVKVWCEPQIQHGERQEWLRPTADGTRFVIQGEVPFERYPTLGFDVVLGPTDYLLLGWLADQPDTLGSVMFGVEADGRPRQRVLVIRANRLGDAPPSDLPPISHPSRRPSIAAEAGRR